MRLDSTGELLGEACAENKGLLRLRFQRAALANERPITS
jgi:hypothetical protein